MSKSFTAVLMAAAIASLLTLLTAPSTRVAADPLSKLAQAALKACTQKPWPYLNCVDTSFEKPGIRVITTDHLAP